MRVKKFDLVKCMWWYQKVRNKLRTLSGALPLTFRAKAGILKNYRIYGDTVNGESVGDRTGNLFDGEIERGSFNGSTGEETNSNIRVRSGKVRLTADNYTINADGVSHGVVYVYALNGDFIRDKSITTWTELPVNFEIDISYDVRFCFRKNDNSTLIPSDIMNIMLNSDSEPLPYEPYGYKVPVTVTNGTDTEITNLYLPEQIKMVGNETEYIDYGEQKQYFADGTSVDVTLPALPILSGTNTLSVGTEVQPSSVEIKGRIKAIDD